MEGLEIHPVITRITCLNQPHLKPWWVTNGLSAVLDCIYNPHQPQIISTEISLPLPKPRITKVRGHTSHALPSEEIPKLKVSVQMGTYLMFYIPKFGPNCSWELVLNGVESVLKESQNHTEFSLHIMQNTTHAKCVNSVTDSASSTSSTNYNSKPTTEPNADNQAQPKHFAPQTCSTKTEREAPTEITSVIGSEYKGNKMASFKEVDKVTSLLDEDDDESAVSDLELEDDDVEAIYRHPAIKYQHQFTNTGMV